MTAAAICMRCGVLACVYPPLFFPHDTTTTSMPPTTTNQDCEGWGELDGDFGRIFPISRRSVRCRDCCLRLHASVRNHHTGIRFDREAQY
ncbi:hypothetical protein B0H14DRAFT_2811011 [Mycena olivaceomarginata]|nr:hypothetical protein B0H14DRAFT_2811011 [Mycena olivaceomarginata]